MTTRLTKNDWLEFSLRELAKYGHKELTANRLASKLGVSRGSFYWHFKDLEDFETALLNAWAERTTEDVIKDLESLTSPKLKLLTLIKRAMDGNMKLERAIRSWAISNTVVSDTVMAVDIRRIAYIEEILHTIGVDKADIVSRAQILYWASIGRMMMPYLKNTQLTDKELDRFTDLIIT